MSKLVATLGIAAGLLGGCQSVPPEFYEKSKMPKLDLREYLNGKVSAQGVLFDWRGRVDRSFTVSMIGKWNGNEGILEEDFIFSDGKKDRRVWKIRFLDDHNFVATAHDVSGEAQGKQYGSAVNMNYSLNIVRDNGKTIQLEMDDWMYRVDENTVMNRTKMKKFGLTVGELMLSFQKNEGHKK